MKILLMSLLLLTAPLESTAESDQLVVKKDGDPVHTIDRQAYAFSFFINESKLDQLLDELDEIVYKKSVDAKLNDKEEIICGRTSKALDREAFNLAFRKFVYQGEPSEMDLPVKRIYPQVDSELLSEISEQEIGSYVTYFKKNNKERTHNI